VRAAREREENDCVRSTGATVKKREGRRADAGMRHGGGKVAAGRRSG
jgi:hypothetical protein